jgi:DNA-binding transcriptional LysR family regulator
MLDWDDLRFFLTIARHRSLAAAAKLLHVTQSTVGRRLASLEAEMGARLLHRVPDGYAPTLAGQAILENVEHMENEALRVEQTLAGHDARLAGVVRVTGSQLMTSHLLAPSFAALHARDRSVMVELVPLLSGESLAQHEADVAVQLRPFEHPDLIVRKLGSIAFGLYAASAYLERCGLPDTEDGCAGHQLITLLDDREVSAQAGWLADQCRRGQVVLRSDSYETQHWATTSGGGLAVLPRFRADAQPELQLVPSRIPVPQAEIWLGVHHDNRHIPRIRAVLDCIAHAVRNQAKTLDPFPREDAQPRSLAKEAPAPDD